MPDSCVTAPLAVRICTPEWSTPMPVRVAEWDAGLVVDVGLPDEATECVHGLARCEAESTQLRAYMQSRQTLLAETQAALDRCQAAQVQPDLGSAWVLGVLVLGGVMVRAAARR